MQIPVGFVGGSGRAWPASKYLGSDGDGDDDNIQTVDVPYGLGVAGK